MTALRDVVIPAGGSIPEGYARVLGTPYRALAPLGSAQTPVMQVVVDALRASGTVRYIIGIAAEPVSGTISGVDQWLSAGGSGPANILRGLAMLESPDAPALVCTSDLPLLTAQDIRDFVARSQADADMTLGLVSASAYEAEFPAAPPSEWVTLRDAGPLTIGCLFGIRPSLLLRRAALLTSVFESRKSQARMARLLGPRLLWQWATKTLTLHALVTRGETILGGRAQILYDVSPRLSYDIDTEDDYTYADTYLRQPDCPSATRTE